MSKDKHVHNRPPDDAGQAHRSSGRTLPLNDILNDLMRAIDSLPLPPEAAHADATPAPHIHDAEHPARTDPGDMRLTGKAFRLSELIASIDQHLGTELPPTGAPAPNEPPANVPGSATHPSGRRFSPEQRLSIEFERYRRKADRLPDTHKATCIKTLSAVFDLEKARLKVLDRIRRLELNESRQIQETLGRQLEPLGTSASRELFDFFTRVELLKIASEIKTALISR
jgi:hypothetical protein